MTSMVIFAMVWLAVPWQDEIAYHFSDKKAVDMGDAIGVMSRLPAEPDAYVSMQGILSNKAATISGLRPGSLRMGPVQVRQFLGASIFVEFDQDSLLDRYQMFTQISVSGRLQDFGPDSELAVAYAYFKDRLKMKIPENAKLLIVDEKPGTLWRYPITLGLCLLIALYSVISLIRSMRVRLVQEEQTEN